MCAPSPENQDPKTIDGVAIVSAIIGAVDVKTAAQQLTQLLRSPPAFQGPSSAQASLENNDDDDEQELTHLLTEASKATQCVRQTSPLSHNMTNLVVQNLSANIALAIGASPIMSNYAAEAADLSRLGGALLINMGTVTPDGLANYLQATTAYNAAGRPVVLDPVGAGATSVRKEALATLMGSAYFDLIKGNEREIAQVARTSGFVLDDSSCSTSQQRGVDSGTALFSLQQRSTLVARLALRERTIVLMTGATDVISDGHRTYTISNGHAYLGSITGSGCALGTTLSAYLAANPDQNPGDKLRAAVAGLLHYEIAAECAATRPDVRGPGTFVPAFIDELYARGMAVAEGREDWKTAAKVECVWKIDDVGLLKEV